MKFLTTSQRMEKLGGLVLGDKLLGKVLGFFAKQGNTLGKPGVPENLFVIQLILVVLFVRKKSTCGSVVLLGAISYLLQFVSSPASAKYVRDCTTCDSNSFKNTFFWVAARPIGRNVDRTAGLSTGNRSSLS